MSLPEICIRRPVFSVVMSLVLTMLGIVSYTKLQLRGTPKIDIPVVTIMSIYPGANPSYMENSVTNIIERSIRTIKGVDYTQSSSSSGVSQVLVALKFGSDIDEAINDIRSNISEISSQLPYDMKLPTVTKKDPDAFATIWMTVSSTEYNDMELTAIVDNYMLPKLSQMNSVGDMQKFGMHYYTMHINPYPEKLYGYGISFLDIERAIKAQNTDYPAGALSGNGREYSIRISGQMHTEREFQNIVIKNTKNGLIKLGDIARVYLGPQEMSTVLQYNGSQTVAVGLVCRSGSNLIDMSDEVRNRLDEIRSDVPSGVNIDIAHDSAIAVKKSIFSVFRTVAEALVLVTSVTFIFLGSIRITIIPFVAIPISIIASFGAMLLLGFSINIFTLLAMVLAIGLVVDDAIVVLENIHRHNLITCDPKVAAMNGSKEISFAIMAMTITSASVFLPIGFMPGIVGKLFIEFAWTLAICVMVSGFVALTITPMMCSFMVGHSHKKIPILERFESKFKQLESIYKDLLIKFLGMKKVFIAIVIVLIGSLFVVFSYVKRTFAPIEDDGYLYVNYRGPVGSDIGHTVNTITNVDGVLRNYEYVKSNIQIAGTGGNNYGFGIILLKDWDERNKSQAYALQSINAELDKIPEMSVSAMNPISMLSGPARRDVEFTIQTLGDIRKLSDVSDNVMKAMEEDDMFSGVSCDLDDASPTIDIEVDRDKAYMYGVTFESIGSTLQYAFEGKEVSSFVLDNMKYDVFLQFDKSNRLVLSDIRKIYVKSLTNQMFSIDNIAKIHNTIAVGDYNHYNGFKAVTISADIKNGHTPKEAQDKINLIVDRIVPKNDNFRMEFIGNIKQMNQSSTDMGITFLLGVVFIYLVLAAQFESFRDPLIILCSVPFSMIGGIIFIIISNNTLNLYSQIGLITLIGLITKNSIMIIEFTHQLMASIVDISLRDAIVEASRMRLRPILMTSLATILGSVPLAIDTGAGAAARNSIGITVVGGMTIGTLFTLFIIPFLYNIFGKVKVARNF